MRWFEMENLEWVKVAQYDGGNGLDLAKAISEIEKKVV